MSTENPTQNTHPTPGSGTTTNTNTGVTDKSATNPAVMTPAAPTGQGPANLQSTNKPSTRSTPAPLPGEKDGDGPDLTKRFHVKSGIDTVATFDSKEEAQKGMDDYARGRAAAIARASEFGHGAPLKLVDKGMKHGDGDTSA